MSTKDILEAFHYANIPSLPEDGSEFLPWLHRVRSIALDLQHLLKSTVERPIESERIAQNALICAITQLLPNKILLTISHFDHPYGVINSLRLRFGDRGISAYNHLKAMLQSAMCKNPDALQEHLNNLLVLRAQLIEANPLFEVETRRAFFNSIMTSVPEQYKDVCFRFRLIRMDDPDLLPEEEHVNELINRLRDAHLAWRFENSSQPLNRAKANRSDTTSTASSSTPTEQPQRKRQIARRGNPWPGQDQ